MQGSFGPTAPGSKWNLVGTVLEPNVGTGIKVGTLEVTGTTILTGSVSVLSSVTITGGTVVADTPPLNVTQTWNNAGVTFNGTLVAITKTAAAAASVLFDYRVGGSSVIKFDLTDNGRLVLAAETPNGQQLVLTPRNAISGSASIVSNSNLEFGDASVRRWLMSVGNIVAVADNAYDIGATGASRPRTMYLGTRLAVQAAGSAANPAITVFTDGRGMFAGNGGLVLVNSGGSPYQAPSSVGSGCIIQAAGLFGWSSTALATGAQDAALERVATDVVGVNSGTAGIFRDFRLRALLDLNGAQVVSTRGAAVADPAGGATIDTECRNQLILLLSRLRAAAGHGLIA